MLMAENKFIAYYRVSTQRQGTSGLGLEAQKTTVLDYLKTGKGILAAEFVEIESGKRADRPKLMDALHLCRLTNSKLIIAKLDRLSRNLAFINSLLEAKVEFVCVDLPMANTLTIQILAAVAEAEARTISERTRAALMAAKARGVKLGSPVTKPFNDAQRRQGIANSVAARKIKSYKFVEDVQSLILDLKASGLSLTDIAHNLNTRGIKTARGTSTWYAETVRRVLNTLRESQKHTSLVSW
jgi:DNA invertase Pin-like site-specific DNA recombinase